MKKCLAILGIAIVLTPLLAKCWWNLWMYRGWVGAPPLITPIVSRFMLVDGEFAYDCQLFDMEAVVFCALCFGGLLTLRMRKKV